MTIIDLYPECPKPDWLKPGAWCYCLGEGLDKFIIDQVFKNSATLLTEDGFSHGMESFTKLFRSSEELEKKWQTTQNQ